MGVDRFHWQVATTHMLQRCLQYCCLKLRNYNEYNFTPGWTEFMGGYNTADSMVNDWRSEYLMK